MKNKILLLIAGIILMPIPAFALSSTVYRLGANYGMGTTTPSSMLSIRSTGTTDLLNLTETGGEEVFTVLESGYVGIGTTGPSEVLSVAGNVLADYYIEY